MGIKGLAKLLSDEAPDSIREVELKSLHGRKVAIDASMAIYQFLIAVRSGGPNNAATMLTNADGETTSHIQGMFNRTIRFMTEGMKPVFVFDGKPPQIKSGELQKRRDKRLKAQQELAKATEDGNVEEQDKQSKRLVRAGQKENHDCQRLLELMGVPVVLAPCEAEAQASALAKAGVVYATATEDMDALTFQTPILLRKMTFAKESKAIVQQMNYAKALEGLGLSHEEFIDLCILLGCDYCDSIKGVGPKTALKLIREHKDIETILKHLDRKKFTPPDDWEPNDKKPKEEEEVHSDREEETGDDEEDAKNKGTGDKNNQDDDEEKVPMYVLARKLFKEHEVLTDVELKWKAPQRDQLAKFLVDESNFNSERVQASIDKLEKAYKANLKPQTRMDNFFSVKKNPANDAKRKKRLEDEKKAKQAAKKQKKSVGPGRKKR